jgi:hypothetical protein
MLIEQSAFIPAVKSILASNDEDEKKRREARRKSLGTFSERGINFRAWLTSFQQGDACLLLQKPLYTHGT